MKLFRKLMNTERGSAPLEFIMSGTLLTLMMLGILQLTLSLYVRNTVVDAIAEGARYASLADHGPVDGLQRSRELIASSLGADFAVEIQVKHTRIVDRPAIELRAVTALPVVGLWGVFGSMEVRAVSATELR